MYLGKRSIRENSHTLLSILIIIIECPNNSISSLLGVTVTFNINCHALPQIYMAAFSGLLNPAS